jgi:hypothetical protein
MTTTDPAGRPYTFNHRYRFIVSDPHVLHLLLTPNRPVVWTWWRFIDKTVAIWEKR